MVSSFCKLCDAVCLSVSGGVGVWFAIMLLCAWSWDCDRCVVDDALCWYDPSCLSVLLGWQEV